MSRLSRAAAQAGDGKILSQNTASTAIIKGEGRFFSMAKGQDRKKETKKPKKDKAK
jgi:hypothetical protein